MVKIEDMSAADIMNSPVLTIDVSDTVRNAAAMFIENHISGVITSRDRVTYLSHYMLRDNRREGQ